MRRLVTFTVISAAMTLGAGIVDAGVAHAAAHGCDTWTGAAGDQAWNDGGNWSMNQVPDTEGGACIPDGSGTINVGTDAAATAAFITIGTGTTVNVQAAGSGTTAMLQASDGQTDSQGNPIPTYQGITNHGTIRLSTTGSNTQSLLVVNQADKGAKFTNASDGTVLKKIPANSNGGADQFRAAVDNQGTIEGVVGTLLITNNGDFHNHGTVRVDSGATISADYTGAQTNAFYNDAGGVITGPARSRSRTKRSSPVPARSPPTPRSS